MKILILHTYNQGYLSKFFFDFSVKLVDEGHQVINFSFKSKKQNFRMNGVDIIIEKKSGYVLNYYHICKLIYTQKPHLIISNFSYANPALLFGKLFGVKKNYAWFHTLLSQMDTRKVNVIIKSQFLKLADLIMANSNITKNELIKAYGVPEKKIQSIPFWSTINEIAEQSSPPPYIQPGVLQIGCPGRMALHKNQQVVLHALASIKNEVQDGFHVYFAGDGEELLNLQQLAKDLEIESNVSFLKHLSADEMVRFYKAMDVIILPSLDEAFGLVFIEAISLNVPVLVSNRFGALSFIDRSKYNLSDIEFNPQSADDLALKLLNFLKNKFTTSNKFIDIYNSTFSKGEIYKQLKESFGL